MKSSVKIVLFVVFFIALGGIIIALCMYNKQHKDLKKIKPDFVITATDLQKAFEDNETSATSKYVNRILEVTGVIESVNTGKENILSVMIKTGSDFSSVICTFPLTADTTKFIVGDQVTIKGECSGFLMDVLLNNCVLIK
jgi:hypothetical protein